MCFKEKLSHPIAGFELLEFLDETYPEKTRGMGLLHVENCMILASTVFEIIGGLKAENSQFCLP